MPPTRVRDLVADVVLAAGWAEARHIAQEMGERWESRVIERIRNDFNMCVQRGRPPQVVLNSSDPLFVQGACFVEPRDSVEEQDRKRRRAGAALLQAMLHKISPDQLEVLCAKLLAVLGASAPQVTRRTLDEGVDFFGRIPLERVLFSDDLTPTIQKQMCVWVVGQAKRFVDGQVGTSVVRELVGAISLARAGSLSKARSPFPDLRIRPLDPVLALLVTTSTFSRSAWALLEDSGVIGVDAEMLAAFLADRDCSGVIGGVLPPPETGTSS